MFSETLNSKKANNITNKVDMNKYSYDSTKIYVKSEIDKLSTVNLEDKGLKTKEYEKSLNRKKNLKNAVKKAPYGDLNSKNSLKAYIRDILTNTKGYGVNEKNIDYIIDFNREGSIYPDVKFDILLHMYKKSYKYRAFEELIEKYKFVEETKTVEEYYCVTAEDIEYAYDNEDITLTFDDKMDLLVNRIYREEIGHGTIDEIKDMNIDGVSGGVNGIPFESVIKEDLNEEVFARINSAPKSYDSVWIFYKGKNVHLEFLSFKSSKELERVCKIIYSYNNPGQLSEKTGYIINDMADTSRVVVLRPPFCESWCFFIRMFDSVDDKDLPGLITGENCELPIGVCRYLMKGCETTVVTGEQGVGKTSLLIAMIRDVYPMLTIRVVEKMFETKLRRILPNRNIVTVREKESADEALEVLKKTDGNVTFLGELADDKSISSMIEVAQVASKFTIATHHAMKFLFLINAFRNSLLKTGSFNNEDLAEEQVVNILKFNIHLSKNIEGKRTIKRITECIPIDDDVSYPTDFSEPNLSASERTRLFMLNMNTYFENMTKKRKFYTYRDIVVYDYAAERYVVKNPITPEKIDEMLENMLEKDRIEFKHFLDKHFSHIEGKC